MSEIEQRHQSNIKNFIYSIYLNTDIPRDEINYLHLAHHNMLD